jgi:hypothetical protein
MNLKAFGKVSCEIWIKVRWPKRNFRDGIFWKEFLIWKFQPGITQLNLNPIKTHPPKKVLGLTSKLCSEEF